MHIQNTFTRIQTCVTVCMLQYTSISIWESIFVLVLHIGNIHYITYLYTFIYTYIYIYLLEFIVSSMGSPHQNTVTLRSAMLRRAPPCCGLDSRPGRGGKGKKDFKLDARRGRFSSIGLGNKKIQEKATVFRAKIIENS